MTAVDLLASLLPLLRLIERLGARRGAARPLVALLAAIPPVWDAVEAAMADGELTAAEADAIADVIAKTVDVRVRVKGRDVVREPAERMFFRVIARVARQTVIAHREDAAVGEG